MTTKADKLIECLREMLENSSTDEVELTEENKKELDELLENLSIDEVKIDEVKSDPPLYDRITLDDGSQIIGRKDRGAFYPLKDNRIDHREGVNLDKYKDIISSLQELLKKA